MHKRFVKRCKCKAKGRVEYNKEEREYGYEIQVGVKCPVCGREYKEVIGKGEMKKVVERSTKRANKADEILEESPEKQGSISSLLFDRRKK